MIVCTAATNWVREQEGWLAANAVKVVLKPFKVEHLEHAIRRRSTYPTVTASAELTESESTAGASTPPGPAKRVKVDHRAALTGPAQALP